MTVDASGKYLFVSTVITSKTGPNCLAVFGIDPTSGLLQQVPGSPFPGSPADCGAVLADPSGPYIYEGTGTGVYVYSLDLTTGVPTEVTTAAVPQSFVTSLAVTH